LEEEEEERPIRIEAHEKERERRWSFKGFFSTSLGFFLSSL